MRLITLLLLLIPTISLADPDFVKNHFIGSPYEVFHKQFKGAPYDEKCISETTSICKNNLKKDCNCKRLDLVSHQFYKKNIYLIVVDDKVIEYANITKNATSLPLTQAYQKNFAFFGDTKPSEIYEGPQDNSTATFILRWKLEDGFASSTTICPLEMVAGIPKVTSKLRDCFTRRVLITKVEKDQALPAGIKGKVQLPY